MEKQGGRQTEQGSELLRLTPPNPPHLTCPNCLHRPSQFVKYGSHPFAKKREKDYTPLPPAPHQPTCPDGSSLTLDAEQIVICNHPVEKSRPAPKLSDLEHGAGMANGW